MRITATLRGSEALPGMRVQYGFDAATRKSGTLTGETRIVHGVTRFSLISDANGRTVWAQHVWAEPTANVAPVAPLAPGDRVEVNGRERIVTSVISGHFRGRASLHVAHVATTAALPDQANRADVATIPHPLDSHASPISPRAITTAALAGQATARRVILPEHTPAIRAAYVAARERGETVPLALSRARLEMVAHDVLTPTADYSGYRIDADALARVTRSPELDALSGTLIHPVTRKPILFPIDVPDGITLTVTTDADRYGEHVADEDVYSSEDVAARRKGEWTHRTVTVTATDADGDELASASLGGVEIGDYWPGGEGAQLWHTVPDLVRQALDDLPTPELPMTCGTCGHRYADNTPAGRCPREADHEPDDRLQPWTIVGVWVNDVPVIVGIVAGDHMVHGGDAVDEEIPDCQGPWGLMVRAVDADEAASLAVAEISGDDETDGE